MAEHAIEHTTVDAPVDDCLAVVLDFERYPEWARALKEVTVASRDDEGRPLEVQFRAAGFGHSTTYRLRYDYSGSPGRLSWTLVESDVCRKLDGYYDFRPADGDPGRTEVDYLLEAELVVPLPAFIKRRTELKIIHTALHDLRARIEQQAAGVEPS
ncbi:MAG TPA: SRPBCC family protein [Acidimicrobiales bacterium]|jgi:hypothetical protein|nr:SRPBCC family protein [Acidimicrobiales bacterium]